MNFDEAARRVKVALERKAIFDAAEQRAGELAAKLGDEATTGDERQAVVRELQDAERVAAVTKASALEACSFNHTETLHVMNDALSALESFVALG